MEIPLEVVLSLLLLQPTVLTIATFESGEVALQTVG
jgi:hypothetical protein